MRLRNGKILKHKRHTWFPICLQQHIFKLVDVDLFINSDRHMMKYLIEHQMISNPQELMCLAIHRRDRWLFHKILKSGVSPNTYVAALARDRNILDEIDAQVSDEWYVRHHFLRGEVKKGLERFSPDMPFTRETLFLVLQRGNERKDEGLMAFIRIFPELRSSCVNFACMYGHNQLLSNIHEDTEMSFDLFVTKRLVWALEYGHFDTLRLLVNVGYQLSFIDWSDSHTLNLYRYDNANEAIQYLHDQNIAIPIWHMEQGLVKCAETGKLSTVVKLLEMGVAMGPDAKLAAISHGHLPIFNHLKSLETKR